LIPYVRARRAFASARLGDVAAARADLADAASDTTSMSRLASLLARGLAQLYEGDADAAVEELDRAVAMANASPKFVNARMEALIELAGACFAAGRAERAVAAATEAADLARAKGSVAVLRRAEREAARFGSRG
jgi:hypothetical protein